MPDAPALTLREALAAVALAIRSELTGGEPLDALEVTFGFAGRRGTVPVAFAAANAADEPGEKSEHDQDAADMADAILAALRRLRAGEYMTGAEIAKAATDAGFECDRSSGSLKRVVRKLRKDGHLDPEHNAQGYRLSVKK